MRKSKELAIFFSMILFFLIYYGAPVPQKDYKLFETPERCTQCHKDIYMQWKQSMMSQAYTHHWDEIEYFKLALPQAEKDPKVAEVKAGCNGCHSPIAYFVEDIPPKPPSENTRANESVSCDVCHTISGFTGDIPYNFNYMLSPGETKFGPRIGVVSPHHTTKFSDFIRSPEFCGTCHNEKSPYGVWVKSTHLEWKEGPYSKEGVRCQDCHMWHTEGASAIMGDKVSDMATHYFPGGHALSKIRGVIEVKLHPDALEYQPGDKAIITVHLYNAKAGHKLPTGSAEERQLWLEVHAIDSKGNVFTLPVDKKGFRGEEFTITSNEPAYFDIGEIMEIKNFKGLKRDDLEEGHRIFRMPYFDPKGRMTIAQWNTASLGVDYRIGPMETKVEKYTWAIPENIPLGKVKIIAELKYRLLVKSVAEFLGVPADEYETRDINLAETEINIVD
ncbi:MAG: multiheme c-type cytochrome [Candidatus Aminicenantia bacterium]